MKLEPCVVILKLFLNLSNSEPEYSYKRRNVFSTPQESIQSFTSWDRGPYRGGGLLERGAYLELSRYLYFNLCIFFPRLCTFFYKEALYKEPLCRKPNKLMDLYFLRQNPYGAFYIRVQSRIRKAIPFIAFSSQQLCNSCSQYLLERFQSKLSTSTVYCLNLWSILRRYYGTFFYLNVGRGSPKYYKLGLELDSL